MPNTPSPAHIANTLMIFLRDSMWRSIIIVLLLFSTSVSGCLQKEQGSGDFILATTTSMRDSGLLDELLSTFSDEYGIFIGVVAVGTGAALKLGENGDADILIVHAPDKEIAFIEDGFGISRTTFAWNRFVLVGPATLHDTSNITEALQSIDGECFISRGDDSGTHIKEQEIWQSTNLPLIEDELGIHPDSDTFFSVGQGMGTVLNMADELQCWALSDMGTWLSMSSELDLQMNTWNDSMTLNPYSIIQIKGENSASAENLEQFILSPTGQAIIANHSIAGSHLFNPGQPNQEPFNNA